MQGLFSFLHSSELAELQKKTGWSKKELKEIQKRFILLDLDGKGFLVEQDLLAIPELKANPLGYRIAAVFNSTSQLFGEFSEKIDFRCFALTLALLSENVDKKSWGWFVFQILDVDGDGKITEGDLNQIFNHLLPDHELTEKLTKLLLDNANEITPDIFLGSSSYFVEPFSKKLS